MNNNIVDSSCWLEYLAGTKVGGQVAEAIAQTDALFVPSIIIYEVFKKLLLETDEDKALFAAAHMKQGRVLPLDTELALLAAKLGRKYQLPLAGSIIYASAQKYNCVLWTQDAHFKGLAQVRYITAETKLPLFKRAARNSTSRRR
ncbi:MAG: type II toxin-antitoxin system VapC family toxin [Candidatus Margulisbacteria bacterium]|jgi:predicted nucleic acid-binding protein|nr:type II toxin-antitoxin system VapC family toxin [Candidatus Margulisiibacteriota bacterium]